MRALALVLSLLLAALAPAQAIAQRISVPAVASGTVTNPDIAYEVVGLGSSGLGATVTNGGSNNSEGAYTPVGTTAAAWSGFRLHAYGGAASATRYLVSVSFDGGSTTHIENLAIQPDISTGSAFFDIPMQVPAGSQLYVKIRASGSNNGLRFYFIGTVAAAGLPPGFTVAERLNAADTAGTRAASSCVTMTSDATTWTAVVADTGANAYGAVLLMAGEASPTPVNSQPVGLRLATGVALSETTIFEYAVQARASSPYLPRGMSPLIQKTIAANARLSINAQAGTPGTDAVCVGVMVFR